MSALYQEAIATFGTLLEQATAAGEREPTATTLATADTCGRISARVVLLKQFDERGFVFFTNYTSPKAGQLGQNRLAALCLFWKMLREGVQVRVEGKVEMTTLAESDAYFASRPRASQIGAWASLQSQTLPDRETFEQRVARCEHEFEGREVTRPPHWGGYVVEPDMLEFWYGAEFRLHERVRWSRHGQTWTSRLLYP